MFWKKRKAGNGIINFDNTFKILADNNYEEWMVVEAEQDLAKANPLEYALKAKLFIKKKDCEEED